MKYFITTLIFILFIFILCIIDSNINEKTPKQQKQETYYDCVRTQYINGRNVSECNKMNEANSFMVQKLTDQKYNYGKRNKQTNKRNIGEFWGRC